MKRISVIVPCYNVENALLWEKIRSSYLSDIRLAQQSENNIGED